MVSNLAAKSSMMKCMVCKPKSVESRINPPFKKILKADVCPIFFKVNR